MSNNMDNQPSPFPSPLPSPFTILRQCFGRQEWRGKFGGGGKRLCFLFSFRVVSGSYLTGWESRGVLIAMPIDGCSRYFRGKTLLLTFGKAFLAITLHSDS